LYTLSLHDALPIVRVDGDRFARLEPLHARLEPFRVDAPCATDVLRLEASPFTGDEVPQHNERADRGHLGEGTLVSHDVAFLERRESDEGGDPVHLFPLSLSEQRRSGRDSQT